MAEKGIIHDYFQQSKLQIGCAMSNLIEVLQVIASHQFGPLRLLDDLVRYDIQIPKYLVSTKQKPPSDLRGRPNCAIITAQERRYASIA